MRFIADLEIHSRYARAVSRDMTIPNLAIWAAKKGLKVIGTGDFTHPVWFRQMTELLEEAEPGLYRLQGREGSKADSRDVRFVISGEVSCIYSKGGRVRRVHHLIFAPSFTAAEKFATSLARHGNLGSDGRPIIGIDSRVLLRLLLDASSECVLIPAHVWTPYFGVFGSMSGFDSLSECFEELEPEIFAIETGLSSDPPMNWRIPFLDKKAIMSSSDAHSLPRIGREATVFDTNISYRSIFDALRTRGSEFVGTIEFFPEEGKYHYDGHRVCKVSWHPEETKRHRGLCPVCERPVTVGVMSRVETLRGLERRGDHRPQWAKPYWSIVPLDEVIAAAVSVGRGSKVVSNIYEEALTRFGNEFEILLNASKDDIRAGLPAKVAEALIRVREGKIGIEPGYDGEYGKIKIFSEEERVETNPQKTLF